MELNVVKNSKLRLNGMKNRIRTSLYIEQELVDYLKVKAVELDTTSCEIIRSLIKNYIKEEENADLLKGKTIVYCVHYGIKEFEGEKEINSIDHKHDILFDTIQDARNIQIQLFDSMIEKIRKHIVGKRKNEQAYSYIQPITDVSESNPEGDDASDTVLIGIRERLNAYKLTFNGSNF